MKAAKMSPLIGGAAALALASGAYYWWNYDALVTFPAYRAPIVDQLKDPASVQTRNERVSASGWICGELNSKNSSGGYVGFKRYISGGREGSYFLEGHGQVGEESHQDMIERLSRKNRVLQEFLQLKAMQPDLPVPSNNQIDEQVTGMLFEDQWARHCAK